MGLSAPPVKFENGPAAHDACYIMIRIEFGSLKRERKYHSGRKSLKRQDEGLLSSKVNCKKQVVD